jgi:hypothetical protein
MFLFTICHHLTVPRIYLISLMLNRKKKKQFVYCQERQTGYYFFTAFGLITVSLSDWQFYEECGRSDGYRSEI